MKKFILIALFFCTPAYAQNYIENAVKKEPAKQTQTYIENAKSTPASVKQGEYDYPLDLTKFGIKLPSTQDDTLKNLLYSSQTIYYKLPQTYQFFQPSTVVEHKNLTLGTTHQTVTKEVFGFYFSSYLPEFNANNLFPWETTFGLNLITSDPNNPYGSINFIHLPQNKPVVVLNETPIKWIFPEGTTAAEVLYVKNQNEKFIYEIRTRTKFNDTWEPNVYRSIANNKELEQYVNSGIPAKKYLFLRNPQEDEVFKAEGFVERIPNLTEEQTKQLLALPFKNVTQESWSESCTTPCSDQYFSIFPKDYSLGLITIDSESCSNCHRQTQITVNRLVPKEPLIYKNPEKVGNIRGSDGIFTWTPLDINTAAKDANDTKQVYLRRYDRDNKIVTLYDPILHSDYKLTTYVQKSLADYELPKQQSVLNDKK